MKRINIDQRLINDKGNVLLICVVIIMILTSLAIYGLNSTMTELSMSGSDKRESTNFQNAETGLRFAISHFKLIYENDDNKGNPLYSSNAKGTGIGGTLTVVEGQLKATELPSDPTIVALRDMAVGQGGVTLTYADNTNTPVAFIEIRDVARNPLPIADLSTFANSVPAFPHLSDPPSGYDSSLYDGRNYVITSTALDQNGNATSIVVQCGIKMAALRDTVAHLRAL